MDGGYIVLANTGSDTSSGADIWLRRLDKDTTAIQKEIPSNSLKSNNFIVSYNDGNISISSTIPFSSSVRPEAFDIKGKLVKMITDSFMQKGYYGVNCDSKRFRAEVYFLKLWINGSAISKKFTILK